MTPPKVSSSTPPDNAAGQSRTARPTGESGPARRLQVLDPDGREQLVSVGAAVFTLRLALRQAW